MASFFLSYDNCFVVKRLFSIHFCVVTTTRDGQEDKSSGKSSSSIRPNRRTRPSPKGRVSSWYGLSRGCTPSTKAFYSTAAADSKHWSAPVEEVAESEVMWEPRPDFCHPSLQQIPYPYLTEEFWTCHIAFSEFMISQKMFRKDRWNFKSRNMWEKVEPTFPVGNQSSKFKGNFFQ